MSNARSPLPRRPGAPLLAPLLAFFLALLLSACGPAPENVVQEYYKAVAGNRADVAVKMFSLQDVKANDMTAVQGKLMMIVGEQYSRIQGEGGLKSVTTKVVEQKDDTATIEAEVTFNNGKSQKDTIHLVKEKNGWKIQLR